MKIKLKDIISPDVSNLELYEPVCSSDFVLQIIVDLDDEYGVQQEQFGMTVYTIPALARAIAPNSITTLRGVILVDKYSYDGIIDEIIKIIDYVNATSQDAKRAFAQFAIPECDLF